MNALKYAAVECSADRCFHIAPVDEQGEPIMGRVIADAWTKSDADGIVAALNQEQPDKFSMDQCVALAKKLQEVSERIGNREHPGKFHSKADAEAWYEQIKGMEVEAHAHAIYAAVRGLPC